MTTLGEKVRDILDSSDFNDLPYEERVRISKYKAHTQILTLWQVLNNDKDLTNERWRKRIRSWLENCVRSYRQEFEEGEDE